MASKVDMGLSGVCAVEFFARRNDLCFHRHRADSAVVDHSVDALSDKFCAGFLAAPVDSTRDQFEADAH